MSGTSGWCWAGYHVNIGPFVLLGGEPAAYPHLINLKNDSGLLPRHVRIKI